MRVTLADVAQAMPKTCCCRSDDLNGFGKLGKTPREMQPMTQRFPRESGRLTGTDRAIEKSGEVSSTTADVAGFVPDRSFRRHASAADC
ncbi:hypothetical protein CKO51_19645 [Rhodopirellula sp. SM50]|nr:hypothetical protein CKO51_19645 [Rhodopirellula sp. SM50]